MNIPRFDKQSKPVRLLLTVVIGLAGGLIFVAVHMPLPWLLGPMTALLVGARFCKKIQLYWPSRLRGWGLIVVGYSSGSSISRGTLSQIAKDLPWMLFMTIAIIAVAALAAFIVSKLSEVDYPSTLVAGFPGGLTQLITLSEELDGVDCTVVTFFQVVRVILIVFCAPLLVFSPLYSVGNTSDYTAAAVSAAMPMSELLPKIVLFTVISVLSAILAKKVKLPTAYMLGPILGVAVFNVAGIHGPSLSPILLDIAQFSIGAYLGLLLKPERLQNKARIIILSVINGLVLVLFSLGLSFILVKAHGMDAVTSFLATAPGGSDQMTVMARVISADVSMVTGYQIFRILFINFLVPPILKVFCRRYYSKCKQADDNLSLSENNQN